MTDRNGDQARDGAAPVEEGRAGDAEQLRAALFVLCVWIARQCTKYAAAMSWFMFRILRRKNFSTAAEAPDEQVQITNGRRLVFGLPPSAYVSKKGMPVIRKGGKMIGITDATAAVYKLDNLHQCRCKWRDEANRTWWVYDPFLGYS
ncbi:MAG: hypothetical protein ACOCWJ_06450 [Verrucomicrobiota bacterium]